MSSTGLTRQRPNIWYQKRLTMARAKNGLSGAVIHLASTGRYGSLGVSLGFSAWRNLAGTNLADSGRLPFLPLAGPPPSMMPGDTPFLAACCGLTVSFVFMKNAAMPQYSSCFQLTNGWLWHWAHSRRTPRNILATLSVILSTVGLPTK